MVSRWVVSFAAYVPDLRERLGDEVPDMPYYALCDWLVERSVGP